VYVQGTSNKRMEVIVQRRDVAGAEDGEIQLAQEEESGDKYEESCGKVD
jgi:hypothetical protein